MRKLQRSKAKKYKVLRPNESHRKKIKEVVDVDYMSNPFRPKYSNVIEIIDSGTSSTLIRKVVNSQFELYAEIKHTRRSKVVRLTENILNDVKDFLPDNFELPRTVVLDLKIYNVDAIGGYYKPTNIMLINSKYNTKKKMLAYLNKNTGYFANTTIYAPILHELGHKYYYDVIEKYSEKENISYNEAEQIIRDTIADYVHKRNENGDFLKKHLSKYAQDGYRQGKYGEIVAEAFSSADKNEISNEIMKLLGGTLL